MIPKKNSHRKYTTLASHPLDISQPTNVSLCTYGGHPMNTHPILLFVLDGNEVVSYGKQNLLQYN